MIPVLDDAEKNLLQLDLEASTDSDETEQNESDKVVPDSQFAYTDKNTNNTQPLVEIFHSGKVVSDLYYDKRYALYHIAFVSNPVQSVSVYEPHHDGTCKNGSYRLTNVMESARARNCILAINAGLFNTETGACYGKYIFKMILYVTGVPLDSKT